MDTVAGGAKGAGEMLLGEVEVESLSSVHDHHQNDHRSKFAVLTITAAKLSERINTHRYSKEIFRYPGTR